MSDIFEISSDAVDLLMANDPLLATELGVAGHDHTWPDLSPAGHAATRSLHADVRRRAAACPTADNRHLLAQQVLVEYCDGVIEHLDAEDHHFDLNNIASPHQGIRSVFNSQSHSTGEDWEAILMRLETIAEPLTGYRQTLDEGIAAGHVVSRRQVETVIEQGATTIGDQSSFHHLWPRLNEADVDSAALRPRLERGIENAKAEYARFNEYLRAEYLPIAVETDAVGADRYVRSAQTFLGTELDPHSTYRWGWDEVERLWAEMQTACAAIDPNLTVAEVVDELQTSSEYAVEEPEAFIEVMKQRQAEALAHLDGVHFDVPPEIRTIDVQIEPAGGALAAHYVGPSEDFSRPGSVWYPIDGRTHFPLFREITIAYHEGFPGHHLQVGVQATVADQLSRFHRVVAWYPGSGEGWALYAEHLMGELGYLERPEYRVGLLSSQLLRSCRIVIDIGIHLGLPIPDDVGFHPGESWTFELALEMLMTRALEREDDARSEVTRYFGWPGQAISYKIGEKAILDLRSQAESKPGFDPKTFHSDLLRVGAIGLDLLRSQVAAPR